MERTLVILKPGCLQRGLVGEVISRFEKRGLKLVAMKMVQLDEEILKVHYAHLLDKPFFPWLRDGSLSAQENVVHTSDSIENAEIELKRFFTDADYCEYKSPLDPFKYAPDEM